MGNLAMGQEFPWQMRYFSFFESQFRKNAATSAASWLGM
jgi:hypothetical protein